MKKLILCLSMLCCSQMGWSYTTTVTSATFDTVSVAFLRNIYLCVATNPDGTCAQMEPYVELVGWQPLNPGQSFTFDFLRDGCVVVSKYSGDYLRTGLDLGRRFDGELARMRGHRFLPFRAVISSFDENELVSGWLDVGGQRVETFLEFPLSYVVTRLEIQGLIPYTSLCQKNRNSQLLINW